MLKLSYNTFESNLKINSTVTQAFFTEENIRYFDNDGFELTGLEKAFYCASGIVVDNCLNHSSDSKEWFICSDEKFKIDHSVLLQRWEFVDEAYDQLVSLKNQFPQLNKYLKLKAKWGYDFALEYYDDDEVLEVLHIENDFRTYSLALESRGHVERMILSTDWNDFVKSLNRKKEVWINLPAMQQNDWKAVHWGLNRAETTFKAFL